MRLWTPVSTADFGTDTTPGLGQMWPRFGAGHGQNGARPVPYSALYVDGPVYGSDPNLGPCWMTFNFIVIVQSTKIQRH